LNKETTYLLTYISVFSNHVRAIVDTSQLLLKQVTITICGLTPTATLTACRYDLKFHPPRALNTRLTSMVNISNQSAFDLYHKLCTAAPSRVLT